MLLKIATGPALPALFMYDEGVPRESPMISLQTPDPRPLEPDWVRFGEDEAPGELDWSIVQRRWNRETKKYDEVEDCGNSIKELFDILDHIMSNGLAAEVTVDATEMGPTEKMPSPQFCIYYKTKCEDYTGLFHLISYNDCIEGTRSNDDCLYNIEASIYNRERITVTIGEDDPTPDYMEIGSMF